MRILITGGNGNIAKIIKTNLEKKFTIINPSHHELDILDFSKLNNYLNNNKFDILIHTAILGGRRLHEEQSEIVYKNLLMFENILYFSNKFKMVINFDSGAIYDRNTDILNRKEDEIFTIPTDYYGFSKYLIYKRSIQYDNVINFRIFNIFHINEENNRFIKSCFVANKNNTELQIYEDKYFDFVYETDFIKIVDYYISNVNIINNLDKIINICYNQKYKLSDIAKLIISNKNNINIINNQSKNNYCGDSSLINKINISLLGLEYSLLDYNNLFINLT